LNGELIHKDILSTLLGSRGSAITAMVAVSCALSFSGLIVRNIEHANPWQINVYRNLAFLSVTCVIFALRYRGQIKSQINLMRLPVLWAALGLATTGIAIVHAFTHTLVANTVFIMSAVPFITMALAYFLLSETVSKTTVITMIVSAIGLLVMIAEGIGSGTAYGNFMALLAALGFSMFAVVARANRDLELLPALLLASVVIILVSVIPTITDLSISAHDLLLCIVWGAGISGIAHWVFLLAARHMAAAELTLFGLFETALAPIWVWFFIRETPGPWVLAGGIAVIVSVGLMSLRELKNGS